MSREFIDFLRRTEIYGCFDGEVVSCEEGVVKPEPRIYEILLDRFGLDGQSHRNNIARVQAVYCTQRLAAAGYAAVDALERA